MLKRKHVFLANAGILFIAISWGLNFSVIKWALSDITPMYYLTMRFLLSGILMGLLFMKSFQTIQRTELMCGILSGLLLALSFTAQTVGLQYTTPGIAGFLANACVVIMPFFVWILYKKRPSATAVSGAFLAFFGLAVMSLTQGFSLQLGDLLQLLCALSFAGQTLVIDYYADKVNPIRMAVVQVMTAGLITLAFAVFLEPVPDLAAGKLSVIIGISYGVVFCTALSFVIQVYAQRVAQPSHVSVILCFEAVFAFLFALLFGYESLSCRNVIGSILVLTGFLIAQGRGISLKKPERKEE